MLRQQGSGREPVVEIEVLVFFLLLRERLYDLAGRRQGVLPVCMKCEILVERGLVCGESTHERGR
jgi:hypothetical protein